MQERAEVNRSSGGKATRNEGQQNRAARCAPNTLFETRLRTTNRHSRDIVRASLCCASCVSLWEKKEGRMETKEKKTKARDETTTRRDDETSHYLSGTEKCYDQCCTSKYLPQATVGCVHAGALSLENTTLKHHIKYRCDRCSTAEHPLSEIRVWGRTINCMHVQRTTRPQL